MADQALAVITPADAKARALALIADNKECVSYVRPEDLDTGSLFLPVVSVIKPDVGDFHDNIPGIGILPKVHMMNLIREKSGVNIERTETSKRSQYVWLAHAYGNKRQADGTMQATDASYEFDAEKRAELDFINDASSKFSKYTSDAAKRKHVLELCKFGEQKAVTGAQLALIHKLAKIPASFRTPEELKRGMIVLRIDRNVDGLLRDPQLRQAAVNMMLGKREEIYGPERDVTPGKPAIAAPVGEPAADPTADDFDEPPAEQPPFAAPAPAAVTPDPRAALRKQLAAAVEDKPQRARLENWKGKSGRSALDLVSGLLADEEATLEELQLWSSRVAKIGGAA